jgi:hypothetical protein
MIKQNISALLAGFQREGGGDGFEIYTVAAWVDIVADGDGHPAEGRVEDREPRSGQHVPFTLEPRHVQLGLAAASAVRPEDVTDVGKGVVCFLEVGNGASDDVELMSRGQALHQRDE